MGVTVMVVEDEPSIGALVRTYLQRAGYQAVWVRSGEEALTELRRHPVKLVVLDIGLPGIDGFEVCRRIGGRVPVIMLTARDEEPDRVAGLEVGADDYVSKPFSIDELLARIRARLHERDPRANVLAAKDLTMDRDRHEVVRGGKPIALTAKEYALLEYLLLHRNKVHTRDELFNGVWGSDFLGDSNLIDVYIRYLRGKIDDGTDDKLIQTVRGVGYALKE
jgi:DNA-binding response OmpR family regulator